MTAKRQYLQQFESISRDKIENMFYDFINMFSGKDLCYLYNKQGKDNLNNDKIGVWVVS